MVGFVNLENKNVGPNSKLVGYGMKIKIADRKTETFEGEFDPKTEKFIGLERYVGSDKAVAEYDKDTNQL